MKIKKLGTDYQIIEKGTTKGRTISIKAYVSDDGITLYNQNEQEEFIFSDSKPEMVKKIGRMIVKASSLTK